VGDWLGTRRISIPADQTRVRSGAQLFVDMCDADSQDLLPVRLDPAVTATKDWTKCEYEFDVPMEAYAISIGAPIDGAGEIYLGGLLDFGLAALPDRGAIAFRYRSLKPNTRSTERSSSALV
jgi:hypothetical protein